MGIASVISYDEDLRDGGGGGGSSTEADADKSTPSQAPTKEATPTFLSGESLTFPLVTAVGTAAITMYAALKESKPDAATVIVVAIICGILVTAWGIFDAEANGGTKLNQLGLAQYFQRITIGLLNTVLLAAALWGTVAVSQAAYSTG